MVICLLKGFIKKLIQIIYTNLYTFSRYGRTGLDLPLSVPVRVQVEALRDLTGRGGRGQVLFIGKDEQWHTLQVLLIDELRQLLWKVKTEESRGVSVILDTLSQSDLNLHVIDFLCVT